MLQCSTKNLWGVLGIIFITNCGATVSTSSKTPDIIVNERHGKNFFPFVWVTFTPEPCGANKDGTCVQRGKCLKRNGTLDGNCQNNFGECCKFTQTCKDGKNRIDVNNSVTILTSPQPRDTPCTYKFQKEAGICQIHLYFTKLVMAPANSSGDCLVDRLKISNSITVNDGFEACGDLTDQHMYLSFDETGTIDVSPIIKSSQSDYMIKATKIPCDSKKLAPEYCLQYFTNPDDEVRSFGFGSQQQNNQKYTVCVKPTSTSSKIKWSPCPGVIDAFDIQSNFDPASPLPCKYDWVQVKGTDKQCNSFVGNTESEFKTYELAVNFNKEEMPNLEDILNFPIPDSGGDCKNCDVCIIDNAMATGYCNKDGDCKCIIDIREPFNAIILNQPSDVNNKGFCLKYIQ